MRNGTAGPTLTATGRAPLCWTVIAVDRGGPVKIGITSDIERRVWQLQNGSPVALVVLHRIPGDLESRLHEACAAFRIRGEWFDGSEEMHAALEAEIGVL